MKESILIVYGSSKGRTARMARTLAGACDEKGVPFVLKNVHEVRPGDLCEHRCIALGSSTYGQGELQTDFLDFEREMDSLDLRGVEAVIFGSGNSRYTFFAEAVDILEARVKILGATLIVPSYRLDMMTSSPDADEVAQWAAETAGVLAGKLGV